MMVLNFVLSSLLYYVTTSSFFSINFAWLVHGFCFYLTRLSHCVPLILRCIHHPTADP
jgi:hypothetical protein